MESKKVKLCITQEDLDKLIQKCYEQRGETEETKKEIERVLSGFEIVLKDGKECK